MGCNSFECGDDSLASSDAGEDYTPTKWHLKRSHRSEIELSSSNRPKVKDVVFSGLAAAFCRTKTTDENATYVISEALRSVGCNSSEVVLSRQTFQRKRMKFRKSFAENLKKSFEADVPLTIFWDGKMSDICGRNIVNRLSVVRTGYGINQLLCFLKLHLKLVKITATAVYNAIQDSNVNENIKSLCFDTTSSNTGLKELGP